MNAAMYTATSDRVCQNLSSCPAGQGLSLPPTSTSDRVCANCTADTYSNQANVEPCTSATVCSSVLEYQTFAPTATSNRVCASLLNCTAGQYVLTNATASSNRVCSTCGSGEFCVCKLSLCWNKCSQWWTVNSLAIACFKHWMDGCRCVHIVLVFIDACVCSITDTFQTGTNAANCASIAQCSAGNYITQNATTSSNRVCGPCESGNWDTELLN